MISIIALTIAVISVAYVLRVKHPQTRLAVSVVAANLRKAENLLMSEDPITQGQKNFVHDILESALKLVQENEAKPETQAGLVIRVVLFATMLVTMAQLTGAVLDLFAARTGVFTVLTHGAIFTIVSGAFVYTEGDFSMAADEDYVDWLILNQCILSALYGPKLQDVSDEAMKAHQDAYWSDREIYGDVITRWELDGTATLASLYKFSILLSKEAAALSDLKSSASSGDSFGRQHVRDAP